MPGSCAGSPYSPMLLPCAKKNDTLLRSTFLGNTQLVSRNLPVTEKKTYEKVLRKRASFFLHGNNIGEYGEPAHEPGITDCVFLTSK